MAPAPPQFWGGGGPRPSSLPTHTLRRRLGAAGLPVHSCVRRWVPGRPLCMGGPGMDRISHTKWATQIGPVAQCMQSLFTPTLCSTPFVPPLCPAPPFSFRCCPVLCLPRPPSFLFSVAVPTPQYTPQYAPAMPRASPRPPPRPPTRHSPGLPPPPAFTWTFNGNTPSPGPLPGPLTGTSPFLPSSSFSFFLFSFPPAPVVAHPACQAGLGVPSRAPGPAQRVHPTPQDQWCSTGTRGRPTEEPQCTPIAPRALTRALNRSFLAGPGPWSLTGASCSSSSSSSLPSFTSIQVYFICCCFVVPPLPLSSPVLFFPSLPWGGYIYFTLCRFLILVRAAQCD